MGIFVVRMWECGVAGMEDKKKNETIINLTIYQFNA
jgi:hypothetical protein